MTMIIKDDLVRLVKSLPGFDRAGDVFRVEEIHDGDVPVVQFACGYGRGLLSADVFGEYFAKTRELKWTEWQNLLHGDRVYRYRTNGKRVVLKRGGYRAASSCHPLDPFSLEVGLGLCLQRIAEKSGEASDGS